MIGYRSFHFRNCLAPLLAPLASYFLLGSTKDGLTFTPLQAAELVGNYLRDPTGSIQLRNIVSSERSCFALFEHGHSAGRSTNSSEYAIPDNGIILSTKQLFDSFPDTQDKGDSDLESLIDRESRVFDPCYIQFEFQCSPEEPEASTHTVHLDYVFGSQEYNSNEDIDDANNDAFGVFLNGENMASAPDGISPITVTTINKYKNFAYFVDDEISFTSPSTYIEAGGYTTGLRASAEPLPGWNSIKLVIGNVDDRSHDSWVFFDAGSLSCKATPRAPTNSSTFQMPASILLS